jgi:hypothetical protein
MRIFPPYKKNWTKRQTRGALVLGVNGMSQGKFVSNPLLNYMLSRIHVNKFLAAPFHLKKGFEG